MADFKRNWPGRRINLSGGVFTDMPSHERPCEDLVNLMPKPGTVKGLQPRDGIEHVLELVTTSTSGGAINEITVDEMARTRLLVVLDADSRRVLRITDHTDLEGRKEVPPLGGGELPITEPEEPEYANALYFEEATAQAAAGSTLTLTVLGTNAGGTAKVNIDLITAEDGVDVVEQTWTVTANSTSSDTVSITIPAEARDGKVFDVYLNDPEDA